MMTESKTIKINLKELIEELIYAHADSNTDEVQELENRFEEVYNKQTTRIKKAMIAYVTNYSFTKDNLKIMQYFSLFPN